MKLKAKLITSFGTVVLAIFLVFAVITQYTFYESLRQSSSEILRLKSEQIALRTKNTIETSLKPLISCLIISGANTPEIDSGSKNIYEEQLADLIENEDLFSQAFLISLSPKKILAKTSTAEIKDFDSFNDTFNKINMSHTEPALFKKESGVFLIWPLNVGDDKSSNYILAKISMKALVNEIMSHADIPGSGLFILQGNKSLIDSFDHSNIDQLSQQDLQKMTSKKLEDNILTPDGRFFLFSSDVDFFGWSLNFIIPKAYFTKNLISLKNRIIAALLIIGWVSIWVILILAYKISNPIQHLSKITKDIIAFNYSTDFQFDESNDEIGELSKNFDTMRVKIKNLIAKDPLTHTFNRRFLMHVFELALLKAIRMEEDLSFIILDIDNFKSINDTYGHQCGDEVLKELGKILIEATRNYDTAARYGGEEFVVVLPNTSITVAYSIAERIRKNMENLAITIDDNIIKCTLSLGISKFDPERASTTSEIINLADQALYEAKRNGKNQTIIHANYMKECHVCEIHAPAED